MDQRTYKILEGNLREGELVTEQSISITKQGGVSENQDAVYVFENDELPVANNTYIFWHMRRKMVLF